MKLVHSERVNDLQAEIKTRFAEFNKTSSPSRGRRYPTALKELIGQAGAQGLKTAVLRRLSGLSLSAINRYRATSRPRSLVPRRLTVVGARSGEGATTAVVIRLSSGVAIELADSRTLSLELLTTLHTLEVRHAASC
jgi:hypothetical protein